MRLITASIALFVAFTLALPHDLRARRTLLPHQNPFWTLANSFPSEVSVEEAAMTKNGQIVPYDSAGVSA